MSTGSYASARAKTLDARFLLAEIVNRSSIMIACSVHIFMVGLTGVWHTPHARTKNRRETETQKNKFIFLHTVKVTICTI